MLFETLNVYFAWISFSNKWPCIIFLFSVGRQDALIQRIMERLGNVSYSCLSIFLFEIDCKVIQYKCRVTGADYYIFKKGRKRRILRARRPVTLITAITVLCLYGIWALCYNRGPGSAQRAWKLWGFRCSLVLYCALFWSVPDTKRHMGIWRRKKSRSVFFFVRLRLFWNRNYIQMMTF